MSDFSSTDELVSIIMPAYNSEKYIYESITSVINQTYGNWEIIIIDDGSKDNTSQIVEKFSKKDTRIRFFKNTKNQGVSSVRNRAISLATGNWIAFLDSDDIWDRRKLEKQMHFSKENSVEFLFTGSAYINEEGELYKGIFEVPQEVTYKKLRIHNVISCSSVFINKRFFDIIKMENDEMHEDYAAWLRILNLGVIAYGINEPLLTYRISRNSKSGNKIKTIKMTYKVFRFIGINPVGSVYFMIRHIIGSINKYRKIGLVVR